MLTEYDLSRSLNLLALFSIIGTFEGLFIGIYLLLKKSVKSRANFCLGMVVLSVTSYLLPGGVYRIGLLPDLPHVVHLHMVTILLMGPFALLYIQSCTQKEFKLRNLHWLHFLPALLALVYHLPFYFGPGEEKIIAFFQWFLEGKLNTPRVITLLKILHPAIYFFICIRLVLDYRKHLTNTASSIDVAFHRWLLVFCLVLLLPVLTVLVFSISSFQYVSATTFFGGLFLFILSVHVATMIKPSLFHAFPHQMLIPNSSEEKKQKYENSKLQEVQKEQYIEKLRTFVTAEKPFLEPELTLAQLSEKVNIPAHYLSQVINEKLQVNFLDFINGYRVKEAQAKLIDPNLSHYTILSIAYEAGFNSKSTFYTAFKKGTDMTPSQYRKKNNLQKVMGNG